jgi:NADPH:quinone reductase-like Zn-dependent oxidoreductase
MLELGAGEAYDYATTKPKDLGRFDAVFDTFGVGMEPYRRLLTEGGRMVSITVDLEHIVWSVLYVVATRMFGSRRVRFFRGAPTREVFDEIAARVDSGELRPVVDSIHRLSEAHRAHAAMEKPGTRGKHVIVLTDAAAGEGDAAVGTG